MKFGKDECLKLLLRMSGVIAVPDSGSDIHASSCLTLVQQNVLCM